MPAMQSDWGSPDSGRAAPRLGHLGAHFAATEGHEVARELVQVETCKGSHALDRRPQLKAALTAARKLKYHVGVTKLDRLSRDVHFISGLKAHNVPFEHRAC
ncbi:recombinase family protein [Bradyrhizobium neotropicale]|uniref:recombinase family protein n=1 Tax=Bradyrhizobium neotropicale TaxID=1497615 RepID=UPI0009ED3C1B